MRYITILIIFCALKINAQSVQLGYKQQLKHVATITFPDTPKIQNNKEGDFYFAMSDGKLYLAEATTIRKGLLDLLKKNYTDHIYNGVISGSLEGTNGRIIYKKNIEANGLQGIEFCYVAKIKQVNSYRYHQAYYFNSTLIFYGLWSADSLRAGDKNLTSFFSTFKTTLKDSGARQDNVSELAFKFGYAIGIVIVLAVIAGLGFGVIFIIRKITG